MCVIVVKEKGKAVPENSVLKDCFQANPDGAGFAYARDGRVEIRKGFMTWRKFRKGLRAEMIKKSDTVVYHFRIGTSGEKSPENTHPFPLVKSKSKLSARRLSTLCAVAHNGIISAKGEGVHSDTFVFVRDVLSISSVQASVKHPEFQKHFLSDHGRFAFLYPTGKVLMTGSWEKDKEIWFSNKMHDYASYMDYGNMYPYQGGWSGGCQRRINSYDTGRGYKRVYDPELKMWVDEDEITKDYVVDEVDQAVFDTLVCCPWCKDNTYVEYVGKLGVRGVEEYWECFECGILFDEDGNQYYVDNRETLKKVNGGRYNKQVFSWGRDTAIDEGENNGSKKKLLAGETAPACDCPEGADCKQGGGCACEASQGLS